MIKSPLIALLATAVAVGMFALAAPAQAFVGYGIEAGTPLHECLSRGYTPGQCGYRPQRRLPRYYYYYQH